jgi:hypothetical protein
MPSKQNQPLTRDEFRLEAARKASKIGLEYDDKNLDLDYSTYRSVTKLLDTADLIAERDESGKLKLLVSYGPPS